MRSYVSDCSSFSSLCSYHKNHRSSCFFFFSSRRRHTRSDRDWSSDVCSSDLGTHTLTAVARDAAGNTKISAAVTITVSNNTGGGGGGGTGNIFYVDSDWNEIGRASCRERV